ncbi:S1/P1 nuclease [Sessilibacter sp. MAH1]
MKLHRSVLSILSLCAVASAALHSHSVLAWGASGHAIVCEIAWQNLDSTTQEWIKPLYKEKGFETFAQSCNWADQIRSDHQYDYLGPMHYVNVPKDAKKFSEDNQICGQKSCVTRAIHDNIKALNTQSGDQAQALLLLGHFVGDIHQPLHVSYSEDWGGNKIQVMVAEHIHSDHLVESNLHAVWDTWLVEQNGFKKWKKSAKRLNQSINTDEKRDWRKSLSPEQWASESYDQVLVIYKDVKNLPPLRKDYAQKNKAIIQERLQQAGIRLAEILNAITR